MLSLLGPDLFGRFVDELKKSLPRLQPLMMILIKVNFLIACDDVARIEQQGKTDFPIYYGFGYRNFRDSTRAISFHRGLDLATPGNTHNKDNDNPVFATASGFVKSVTCDKTGQTNADLDNKPQEVCERRVATVKLYCCILLMESFTIINQQPLPGLRLRSCLRYRFWSRSSC